MQLAVRKCGLWKGIQELSFSKVVNPFHSIGILNIDDIGNVLSTLMDTLESFKSQILIEQPISQSDLLTITNLPSIDSSEDERNMYWNGSKKFSRPTVEGYASTLLESYWNGFLSMNSISQLHHLRNQILLCSDILQSILIVEYANPLRGHDGGGWTNTVESGIDAANKNLQLAMLRLHLPPLNLYEFSNSSDSFKDVEYAHGTSVSSEILKNSIVLLNHALTYLPQVSDVSSPVDVDPNERLKWILKFHDAILSVLTYLSIVMFELLTFLFSISMRSLLKRAAALMRDSPSIESESFLPICFGAMISLIRLPRPWGGAGRSDILSEIWTTWNSLRSHARTLPPQISRWIWSESYHRYPVLIINLDARSDRLFHTFDHCVDIN